MNLGTIWTPDHLEAIEFLTEVIWEKTPYR